MNRTTRILGIFLFGCSVAHGVELSTESNGEATRRWLELQRSGAVASPIRQTLSGPVAENIHERYLNSFKYPIPDLYYQDEDGGSGLNSNQ